METVNARKSQFLVFRYVDGLVEAHDEEHLTKFEELLEAAIDLDRIPDEYLICASYDAGLKVSQPVAVFKDHLVCHRLKLLAFPF